MDLYFEEYLGADIKPIYKIGDIVSFTHLDEKLYTGQITEIPIPCFHHNIYYIFYVITEEKTGECLLIEENKIKENFIYSFLILEIEYEKKSNFNEIEIPEYKKFSFVIM